MAKQQIDDFVKNHKHINYCEAIIHKDGSVEYAEPSHVEKLINVTGENRNVVYNKIPIYEFPIYWLVEYTGCVSVWYEGHITPKDCTDKQIQSLNKLINNKIILNKKFN
ncbi:MAG TPA: hypothetical protein PKK61_05555 [Defluviitaleaceae bacterium]|nr:hypothetical protein [Defluviitaleaceae bacterium]